MVHHMPATDESGRSGRHQPAEGFLVVDLSSPHLADLLDERIRTAHQPVVGIEADITTTDLDRMPIQRGIAIVERAGLRLAVVPTVLDELRRRHPTLTAQARPSIAGPRLAELLVGDEPRAWEAAGFTVEPTREASDRALGTVTIGSIEISLLGRDAALDNAATADGILGWRFTPPPAGDNTSSAQRPENLDGIATTWTATPGLRSPFTEQSPAHANGAERLDHVVMTTPTVSRSIAALEQSGFELRRIREIPPNQQAFFWAGETIIELVGPAEETTPTTKPAKLWGLAFTSGDLALAAEHLGDRLSSPKDAVQAGRQIATLRGNDIGVSVPIVLMSKHKH